MGGSSENEMRSIYVTRTRRYPTIDIPDVFSKKQEVSLFGWCKRPMRHNTQLLARWNWSMTDKVWRGGISSTIDWPDMVVDWISTIYHWLTGFIYSQLEASQGDCVSAEIDAWAFAGRWESVVCMKPWTLQAYKTTNPTNKKSGGSGCFSLKVKVSLNPNIRTTSFRLVWRGICRVSTWGLSTSEVDLLKGQGVAPPSQHPGFFRCSLWPCEGFWRQASHGHCMLQDVANDTTVGDCCSL